MGKPVKSPMEARVNIKDNEESSCIIETKPHRELVGCLMYLMLYTRPDIIISSAINYYSRFQNCATESHWNGLKRILRYIKRTLDYELYRPKKACNKPLQAYVDADWANNKELKSVTGYLIQVYRNTMTWTTKKQATIALSSTESEYIALATVAAEILWWKYYDQEIDVRLWNQH